MRIRLWKEQMKIRKFFGNNSHKETCCCWLRINNFLYHHDFIRHWNEEQVPLENFCHLS
jgi:hypothetical protein